MVNHVIDEGGNKRYVPPGLFTMNFISVTLGSFACSLSIQTLVATLSSVASPGGSNIEVGLVSGTLNVTTIFSVAHWCAEAMEFFLLSMPWP